MAVIVTPKMSEDFASGIRTLIIISHGDAPIAWAASTTPASTSRRDVSTILATNGIAAIVSGTIAAPVPMEVPIKSLVNGIIATIRMTKGIDLPILTTVEST